MRKKLMHKGRYVRNKESKKYTTLVATAEKVAGSGNELVTLQFACKGLPKMDGLFGKSDPYFVIERVREDHKTIRVYGDRENYIKRCLNPVWDSFSIEAQTLCNCDEYRPIRISVYDWDSDGGDDYIGSVQTSLHELRSKPQGLKILRKSHRKKNKVYGVLNVLHYSSVKRPSFLDYMQGPVDMGLMVAIDFTGSNGDPRDPNSLHYFTDTKPSFYQQAIRQIGNILSVYDTDQMYPVFGFGGNFNQVLIEGKTYWNGTKHDFNLNFKISNPEVNGIIGIENAYTSAIKQSIFRLSGPTCFEPILLKAKAIATIGHQMLMQNKENNEIQYYILLIITDGIITDMRQTKNAVVSIANSFLPISIIIVGVGDADFSKMNELDGDDGHLMNSNGQIAKRDVVQFVPMNKYKRNLAALSCEVLKEIPNQFLSYTQHFDIKPGKKIPPKNEVIEAPFQMTQDDEKDVDDQQDIIASAPPMVDEEYWNNVPLPIGWERGYDENGRTFYVDHINHKTQWQHPSAMQK